MTKKWDLVLDENLSFSLTPQFIEVLEWTSIGPNCFNSFLGRSNKPLKRFEIPVGAQHPTERGVLMRTRLAYTSPWVECQEPAFCEVPLLITLVFLTVLLLNPAVESCYKYELRSHSALIRRGCAY